MAAVTLNGELATSATIHVPHRGPWWADVAIDSDAEIEGSAELEVFGGEGGSTKLLGTAAPERSGTHSLVRMVRVVAGAGAWGDHVPARGYANDAGVKARNVIEDLASAIGETLAPAIAPATSRLGSHWTRRAGPAGESLSAAAGAPGWYVDFNGITQVGARPSAEADDEQIEILDYDPVTRMVTLSAESLDAIPIGATLSKDLDDPVTIHSIEFTVRDEAAIVYVWGGGASDATTQTTDALRAIVEHVRDERLLGTYRYRVSSMAGKRVDLQVVRKASGLPDLLRVSEWVTPGLWAKLQKGSEVLVQFIDGLRNAPVITGAVGADGDGHVPDAIEVAGGGQRVARQGDLVQSGGVGTVLTLVPLVPGTVSPSGGLLPSTPLLVSFSELTPTPETADPLFGAVSTGSPKVTSG